MTNRTKSRLNHLIQHGLFWVISFFVLLRVMDQDGETTILDVIYTSLFHIHLIAFVSFNVFLLIPKHLEKGKYWVYGITSLFLFFFAFHLYHLTFSSISDWVFPDFYFVAVYNPLETFGILLIYYVISTLLVLSKSWFEALELKKENAELKELNSTNELKALRAQISPHFLFNSLNTIYGLSIKKAPETPERILSLSQILRYNLEQSNDELANLSDEIDYLKEYIKLQKVRLDHSDQLRMVLMGKISDQKIPALMLIEFLENALKHGNIQQKGAFVILKITVESNSFEMVCSNSIDKKDDGKLNTTGVGLSNIRKRLDLLYPKRHQLEISENDHEFEVTLRISYD
ncbi:MAG: histidine kinase [Balneolaceae bacterium]|nr:histidine kinase [Balneolaceae bacterium]